MQWKNRTDYRKRRHLRIRKTIKGTAERPRMSIMLSSRYGYVQFIDDDKGVTLASASSLKDESGKNNVASAKRLGKAAADAALKTGIKAVVVDRGGFRYQGRIKAIVEAAVESGLQLGAKEDK